MKKYLMLIAAAMVAGAARAATETVDGITWTYKVSGGNASVYAGKNTPAISSSQVGEVKVPDQLGGYPVTKIGDYAFYRCSKMTEVSIPSGVTSIGERAFFVCLGLTSVTIPSSVKSIGSTAFYGCSGLKNIAIPSSVTSIPAQAFSDCSGLTSVTIPSSVTSIGVWAFSGCSALMAICVDEANSNYKSVNGLLLSKDGTILVAGLNGDVTIPAGVTSIDNYAFYGLSGLASVTIPSSVTSIGNYAFNGCSGLTSVTIPSSVKNIGDQAFCGCTGLTQIAVDPNNPNYASASGLLLSKDGKTLIRSVNGDIVIPSSVTSIGNYAFNGCSGLTSVTIPSTVTSIGNYAFCGCSGLTSVTIPDGVTSIGDYAFSGCYLTNVVVEGFAFVWLSRKGLYDVPNKKWIYSLTTTAHILNTVVRGSDPTVIDVVYRVNGVDEAADVRVLAFLDGTTSFAKVIRPETFVNNADGTPSEIGAGVSMRKDHKFAWKVSADYDNNLAKFMMQVFAKPKELLPLQLRTIPANGDKPAYEVSINTITDNDVMNALYWLYAENTSGLSLSGGVLRNGSTQLASGTTPTAAGAQYIFQKMGYTVLSGTMLNYVNTNLRLGLSPSGTRQYGYREVSSEK